MIRWFYPGMKVKRWIVLALFGFLLFFLGLLMITGKEALVDFIQLLLSLEGHIVHAHPFLSILIMLVGIFCFFYGLRQSLRSVFEIVRPRSKDKNGLVNEVYYRRVLEKGPRVVVLGGGTGLPTLLRGLKDYTSNITAIVTVADDGGSSGKLREEMGILPPGDIRNCLVALADVEPLMQNLFQYRFATSYNLDGHSFGNLFIAAMTKISGDFETAIRHMSKVLAVRGQVLPSTRDNCVLIAEYEDGDMIHGESSIPRQDKDIKRVYLEPQNCTPHPVALEAIEEAEVLIFSAGSLYTSIIPNLLVPGMGEAIQKTKALRYYVCNIMTQPGETQEYKASDHLQALEDHGGRGIVDCVIVNNRIVSPEVAKRYKSQGAQQVEVDLARLKEKGVNVVEQDLLEEGDTVRHNSKELAHLIMEMYLRYNGNMEKKWHSLRKLGMLR